MVLTSPINNAHGPTKKCSRTEKRAKSAIQILPWLNIFGCPTCLTYPNHYLPHLTHSLTLLGLSSPLSSSHLLSFLFFSLKYTHSSPSLSHRVPRQTTISTIIFSGKITGKSLRTSKHLYIFFFEVKFLIFFVGFIFCLRLYFYLSFDNDTHVIYEFWKWYLCVYMYEFCLGGFIWWAGFLVFTMVAI